MNADICDVLIHLHPLFSNVWNEEIPVSDCQFTEIARGFRVTEIDQHLSFENVITLLLFVIFVIHNFFNPVYILD